MFRPVPKAGRCSFNPSGNPVARYPMRAEMEAVVDEIKQALSLLRRHL